MRNHILRIIKEFSDEGHSGFSAKYTINILTKLMKYEPLSPLTGKEDEWTAVDFDSNMMYQNNRCYRVFKRADGTAYDSEGRVFVDSRGNQFTTKESLVDIHFPYTPNSVLIEGIYK